MYTLAGKEGAAQDESPCEKARIQVEEKNDSFSLGPSRVRSRKQERKLGRKYYSRSDYAGRERGRGRSQREKEGYERALQNPFVSACERRKSKKIIGSRRSR
jgi:hypothetical protein